MVTPAEIECGGTDDALGRGTVSGIPTPCVLQLYRTLRSRQHRFAKERLDDSIPVKEGMIMVTYTAL